MRLLVQECGPMMDSVFARDANRELRRQLGLHRPKVKSSRSKLIDDVRQRERMPQSKIQLPNEWKGLGMKEE